ncbi:hypothetical protein [Rhizobium sullae]
MAGVRLIIAASFERIYWQNCDSIGLLASADTGSLTLVLRTTSASSPG